MKKEIIVVLVSLIAIFSIFVQKDEVFLVDTVIAEKTAVSNNVYSSGYIQERNKDFISINQNGVVESIHFNALDYVKKGDLIMTINTQGQSLGFENILELIDNQNSIILHASNDTLIQITSNIDGLITKIPQNTGQSITAGVPFLYISTLDNYVANISISEKNIKDVSVGQKVYIEGKSFDGVILGVIEQITPYASVSLDLLENSKKISIDAVVSLENAPQNIINGCSVDAKIVVDTNYDAIVLPYKAVGQDENGEYVMVLENNIAVKKSVNTGYELSNSIEILNGIQVGEQIILQNDVQEGEFVKSE